MSTICSQGISPFAGSVRLAGLVACALLAAACHGGLDNPVAPGASTDAALSATNGDEASSGVVASTMAAPVEYAMASVDPAYSGTCSLAAARTGFRLKAQGSGIPGTVVRFHLIRADGFRTTAFADVGHSGSFRTGQDVVTGFPPNAEVTCVLMSLDDALLAESEKFIAP